MVEFDTTKEQLEKQKETVRVLEQKIQQMSLVERKDAETQFNCLIPMSGKVSCTLIEMPMVKQFKLCACIWGISIILDIIIMHRLSNYSN